MSKYNKNIIDSALANKIHSEFLSYNTNDIKDLWSNFKKSEKFVNANVSSLLEKNTKGIITMLLAGIDPEADSISEEKGAAPSLDEFINESINIAKCYERMLTVFQVIYLYGFHTGKALTDVNFENNFNLDNIFNPNHIVQEQEIVKSDHQLENSSINEELKQYDDILSQLKDTHSVDNDLNVTSNKLSEEQRKIIQESIIDLINFIKNKPKDFEQ